MKNGFDIHQLPEMLDIDHDYFRNAKVRQVRFWRKDKLDFPLIVLPGALTAAQENIPSSNYDAFFADKELMLCSEVRSACACANARSDAVPSIRANLGTGILLSCLGLQQQTFPDKMPWLTEHLTKAQIARLTPDDIQIQGDFARGLEMMRFFQEIMGDTVAVYLMDTQGPFDLAHLLLGDELFMQLYDDPPFVHHLLNLCVELSVRTTRWMKAVINEPDNSLHHSNGIYSEDFGIRICEDTSALVGTEHIEEFVIPYSRKLARTFGAAWVHYCGRNDNLTQAVLAVDEFKALNFGHIPGHVYDHDFFRTMEFFRQAGKINYNWWPLLPGETYVDYLKRLHSFAKEGVLLPVANVCTTNEFDSNEAILQFWKGL